VSAGGEFGGWDAAAFFGAAGAAGLYAVGLCRAGGRAALRGDRRWRSACYFAGVAIAAVALAPPLVASVDVRFAAHMAQHEILMLVVPLLVALGRPSGILLWGVPAPLRRTVARAARMPRARRLAGFATTPAVAFTLQAALLWLWHLPGAFDGALRHESAHALQHASFMGSAALFWWAVLHGRFGRAGYGAAAAFVFATALHTGALGALLAFAPTPRYATHAARAASVGVDPLADQQLAGLLMWIPAGVVLLAACLGLFAAWLGEARRRSRSVEVG
jgi:cytochrome c oxidase assembly factor CtaG